MPAAKYQFIVEQGATWAARLVYRDSDNVPIHLGACTAAMQVRRTAESPNVVVELSTANGRITFDAPNGRIMLALTPTQTAAIPAGAYVYDLELTKLDGTVERLVEGDFIVRQEVTR